MDVGPPVSGGQGTVGLDSMGYEGVATGVERPVGRWHDVSEQRREDARPPRGRPASGPCRRSPAMTNVFAVVGEHREEPSRLLLLGDDGHYYAYGSTENQPTEVEPTDEWEIDQDATFSIGY